MSQIVVTNDKHRQRRQLSLAQEKRIDIDTFLDKWRMRSMAQPTFLSKAMTIGILPIIFFWVALTGILAFTFSLFIVVLRVLNSIFRR